MSLERINGSVNNHMACLSPIYFFSEGVTSLLPSGSRSFTVDDDEKLLFAQLVPEQRSRCHHPSTTS